MTLKYVKKIKGVVDKNGTKNGKCKRSLKIETCYYGMVFLCNAEKVDQNTEAKLVVQALRINTMSKLTFSDSMRFDALLRDVFPGAYHC